MKALRVAVSGAGRAFERLYLPAINACAGLELVAVAEPRFERFSVVPGSAARAATVLELLDRVEIDALIVLSPPGEHLADALAALERVVPVLVEKPLCETLAECETLRTVGAEHLLTPAFTRCYWPAYQEAVAFPPAGEMTLRLRSDPGAWSAIAAIEPVVDLAPHVIDLARWLSGGEIADLTASQSGAGVTLNLAMSTGVRARLVLEWPGEYREVYRGDGRVIRVGPPSMAASLARRALHQPDPPVGAVRKLLDEWVARLRGDRTRNLPDFADGVATVSALAAIRERLARP